MIFPKMLYPLAPSPPGRSNLLLSLKTLSSGFLDASVCLSGGMMTPAPFIVFC